MTAAIRILLAVLLALVLAGCSGSSPAADLQTRMNAVIDAANSRDAAALRTAVERFEELVAAQSQNGDITATRSQALRTLAERVLVDASALDTPTPTPIPTPTATPTPTPTPTPTATPSPRSPSASPSSTATPSGPPVSSAPGVGPGLTVSPSPAVTAG